jgi:hypothetical protein
MGNPSIDYAEKTLGVHAVYEAAQQSREMLIQVGGDLVDARANKREFEALLSDHELDIIADEAGKNPTMSQAALDRHLKVVFRNSDSHQELRQQIRSIAQAIDKLETKKAVLEADIRIGSARLSELGGYLQYLAAVKMARPKRSSDTNDTSDTGSTE